LLNDEFSLRAICLSETVPSVDAYGHIGASVLSSVRYYGTNGHVKTFFLAFILFRRFCTD